MRNILVSFSEEIFQIFLVVYLALLLLESTKTGFVSDFFNLNILLGILLISGVTMALAKPQEANNKVSSLERMKNNDFVYIALMAIIGGIFVFYKTNGLGYISIILSILSSLLITLLSFLILSDQT